MSPYCSHSRIKSYKIGFFWAKTSVFYFNISWKSDFVLISASFQISRQAETLSIAKRSVSYTLQKRKIVSPGAVFSWKLDEVAQTMCWSRRAWFCANRTQFCVTLFERVSSPLDDLKKQIQTKHHVNCGEYGSLASGFATQQRETAKQNTIHQWPTHKWLTEVKSKSPADSINWVWDARSVWNVA